MTNLEAVSQISNAIKINNNDDYISRRFILNTLRNTAKTLISQRLLDRTLSSELNLFSHLPCFEFKKIDAIKCLDIEFRKCSTLMKSKKPLPELIFSRLGASIKDILSLDGDYRFTYIEKGQYARNKKRQHSVKGEVYIYLDSDMHLYIPDHLIYSLDLTILTPKPEQIDECSSCGRDECRNYWEENFICPDKLIESVFSITLQTLGITKQLTEDPNLNGLEKA